MKNSTGKIAYSGGMGCYVQLVDTSDGIWLYRLHGTHWCSVRKATDSDIELFKTFTGNPWAVWQAEATFNGGEPFPINTICEGPGKKG